MQLNLNTLTSESNRWVHFLLENERIWSNLFQDKENFTKVTLFKKWKMENSFMTNSSQKRHKYLKIRRNDLWKWIIIQYSNTKKSSRLINEKGLEWELRRKFWRYKCLKPPKKSHISRTLDSPYGPIGKQSCYNKFKHRPRFFKG